MKETLSLELRQLQAQPVLLIRSTISRSEIAATIAASLGRIVPHALRSGGRIAGMPFARYPDFGQGRFAIEVGMPLVAAVPGDGDIESSLLPGGRAAMAVHAGPYTTLAKSFAALERWMAEQGLASNGAPWEVYANDPADFPDSADWRTEIYWPVK